MAGVVPSRTCFTGLLGKGTEMPRKKASSVDTDNVASLIEILTDPAGTAESLTPEEQRVYEEAKRSVVEARFQSEPHEGQIRII